MKVNTNTQILIIIHEYQTKNNIGISATELLDKSNLDHDTLTKCLADLSNTDLIKFNWGMIDGIYSKTIVIAPESTKFVNKVVLDLKEIETNG